MFPVARIICVPGSAELGIVIFFENAPVLFVVAIATEVVSKVIETISLMPNETPLTFTDREG